MSAQVSYQEETTPAAGTIFLADADPSLSRALAEGLRLAGYRSVVANNCEQALERLWWIANEITRSRNTISHYVNAIVICRHGDQTLNRSLVGGIRKIRALAGVPVVSFLTEPGDDDGNTDRLVAIIDALFEER